MGLQSCSAFPLKSKTSLGSLFVYYMYLSDDSAKIVAVIFITFAETFLI